MVPGEVTPADAPPIVINGGRRSVTLTVRNTGDRAVQVGSHYHFFEVNRALEFDRAASFGMRLDIPSGTAIRFEPGAEHSVSLVDFAGTRRVVGFSGLANGSVDSASVAQKALEEAGRRGFKGATSDPSSAAKSPSGKNK